MTSALETHTFLQISNLNLDSPALVRMGLNQEHRITRAREVFGALARALAEAKARKVDAVYVVGNLWDNGTVGQETIFRVLDTFNQLGDLPVFIAPGKNDAYTADSPYNPHFLRALGLRSWSDNVHIFPSHQLEGMAHPFKKQLRIWGHSYVPPSPECLTQWRKMLADRTKTKFDLLLITEPVEGTFAANELSEPMRRHVLTEKELLASGFDYVAMGFGSNQSRLRENGNGLLGAQAGSLVGQRFSEVGPRVALFGRLKKDSKGTVTTEVEPVEFDKRRILTYSADMSGMTASDAIQDITQSLEDLGARKGVDIIYLELEGRYQVGQEPTAIIEKIKESFFQAVVQDNTRPDYLAETFANGSSEARFIKAMLVLKKEAEKRMSAEEATADGEEERALDHLSGRIVEDALYYGLEALRQKRVNLRNVD
jgi:DNA repair exonuclease SbcCD nuclease subunit